MSMIFCSFHLPLAALSLALPWAPQLGSGNTHPPTRTPKKEAGAAGDIRGLGEHQLFPCLAEEQEAC